MNDDGILISTTLFIESRSNLRIVSIPTLKVKNKIEKIGKERTAKDNNRHAFGKCVNKKKNLANNNENRNLLLSSPFLLLLFSRENNVILVTCTSFSCATKFRIRERGRAAFHNSQFHL